MSAIRSLYTAIAAWSVSYTPEAGGAAVTPAAKDLSAAPKALETGHLPVRVLLPTQEWGSEAGSLILLAAGNTNLSGEFTWSVTDLMLHKAVGQGIGFQDVLPDLIRYAGAYADKALATREPATNMRLVSLALRPGVFIYPMGTDRSYFGVEALLSYTELLNP